MAPEMDHPPLYGALSADKIVGALSYPVPYLEVKQQTGSTNDDARVLARAGKSHGACVVAAAQTAGKGRRGRAWSSPVGGIYFSCVVRQSCTDGQKELLGEAQWGLLPLACGLGVCEGLEQAIGVRPLIKWPNDLVAPLQQPGAFEQRTNQPLCEWGKLGGILVEYLNPENSQKAHVPTEATFICGIGINAYAALHPQVNRTTSLYPLSIQDLLEEQSDSQSSCVQQDHNLLSDDISYYAAHVISSVLKWIDVWKDVQNHPALIEVYERNLAWRGCDVTVIQSGSADEAVSQFQHGICAGITKVGALRLKTEHEELIFHSGDVSLRLTPRERG